MPKKRTIITNSIICCMLLVLGWFVFNLDLGHTYINTSAPLYNGNRDGNQIALMFIVDNNDDASNLPTIMQALENAKASATFFITATTALDNLGLIQELNARFELGNYGFTNQPLNLADKNTISTSIKICDNLIKSITGQQMTLFSPPAGLYNKNTLAMADNLGYRTILPSNRKVSIDWQNTDTNLVTSYATYDTQPGDIILLRPVTATRLSMAKILANYLSRDLDVTSVGNLLSV